MVKKKKAEWVEVAELIASRPIKITRGTKEINGTRMPKE